MLFLKQDAPVHLAHIVRQFWIAENPDSTPVRQKIVPDGYGEIILHYGDPYRIQLYDTWEVISAGDKEIPFRFRRKK